MNQHLYHYQAFVTAVYDGDTITVDLDLGCGIWRKGLKLRLFGIDTPEMRGEERPEGIIARDFVRDLILDDYVIIETIKDKTGKYGRLLAKVWYQNNSCLNDILVEEGLAVRKDY